MNMNAKITEIVFDYIRHSPKTGGQIKGLLQIELGRDLDVKQVKEYIKPLCEDNKVIIEWLRSGDFMAFVKRDRELEDGGWRAAHDIATGIRIHVSGDQLDETLKMLVSYGRLEMREESNGVKQYRLNKGE